MPGLGLQYVLGKFDHFARQLDRWDVLEILGGVADLVGVVQRRGHQPLVERLQHHDTFAARDDDAAEPHHVLAPHRLADDDRRVLPDLVLRDEIVRAVEVALVDLGSRHELFDVDRVGAFEPQRFQLFVLDRHELVAADLVSAALLPGVDHIARYRVHELLLEPIAGALVDLPKGYALARRQRGEHRDWAGDERELEVAFPKRPKRVPYANSDGEHSYRT